MSHELRTPLNAVLGYAQVLMRDDALSQPQRQGLATIRHSGEHLLALINAILDLAKIDAGRLELCPEPLPLPEFVRVIADIIRIETNDKKLAFDCEVPPGLPAVVVADEKRLRQVLLNLLNNAVKFTDAGGVSLRVASSTGDRGAARLRFEVQDSGPGISADEHEAIFHPFVQGGPLQGRSSGAGLGLAVSRQLTRLMGGELHLESGAASGSRFWFEIDVPVVGEPAAARQPQDRVSGDEGARPTATPLSKPDEAPLVPPSGEELAVLHRLAKVGHMRSIHEHAKRLGEQDERCRPFTERLCSMADRFESRAIVELIERYREASG